MKIAVWKTGHEIADRVAESFRKGIYGSAIKQCGLDSCRKESSIAYGILRGTAEVFRQSERWFNVDRGYFNPAHYDGYYRISYRGTQARYDAGFPVNEHSWEMEPIRKYDSSKPVLICPPTAAVCNFFGLTWREGLIENRIIRKKGDQAPIRWDDYRAVVTFNSSIGWQAIQRGIPCLSDIQHSVVGSYYNTNSLDELIDKFNSMSREPLLNFMRAHQFTLAEIEQGKACSLIAKYTSVGTEEKPFAPMSPLTPSPAGLQGRFQSPT